MKRTLICLCLAMSFFAGFPGAASSAITWWGDIWYAGYVAKGMDQMLCADTLIVLINPNGVQIEAILFVYDKKGNEIKRGRFLDGGVVTRTIPPSGYGWLNLSRLVPGIDPGAGELGTKYSYRIRIGWPDGVSPPKVVKAPVVEVKEILFDSCTFNSVWDPTSIKSWSETSLGGDNGTGFYWLPTQ